MLHPFETGDRSQRQRFDSGLKKVEYQATLTAGHFTFEPSHFQTYLMPNNG